jgi:hypothetical protein
MMGTTLVITLAMLCALAVLAATALKVWQGWLTLKHRELDIMPREIEGGVHAGTSRIELADLRERIRKLEAIAAGVDL